MIYKITIDSLGETILIKDSPSDIVIDGVKALSLEDAFEDEDGRYYNFARAGAIDIMKESNPPITLNGVEYGYCDVLSAFDKGEFERELEGTITDETDVLHIFVSGLEVSRKEHGFKFFGQPVTVVKLGDFF